VCVPQVCDCGRTDCRYRQFLDACTSTRYLFQICNHNLLLADAIHQSQGRKPILSDHAALVIDEAHKLPETACQMFRVTLCAADIFTVIQDLHRERFLLAADSLAETSKTLTRRLSEPWKEERPFPEFLRLLIAPERTLHTIQRQLEWMLSPAARNRLATLAAAVSLFCEGDRNLIFYTAEDEQGGTMLCATLSHLTAQLQTLLWAQSCGMVLASATLAAGGSFRHYKEEIGLLDEHRVCESISLSPFDYRSNCLLYLPEAAPRQRSWHYHEKLTGEITALLDAACGHALVLFTSYASMSAVKELLKGKVRYPIFTMSRSAVHTLEQFKGSPGAVLLAAGSVWEGFDFPGDHVSLLIIPRLPFARPDTRKEQERNRYPTLAEFIQAVAVPEMQIKLKQGFGRAIRTETDTCVIAILDERSVPGGRYFLAVTEALPEMPITGSLQEVERFIQAVKDTGYFLEAAS